MNITNITQFNKPTLMTSRETPYHLHLACPYVPLINPDIARRISGCILLMTFSYKLSVLGKEFECALLIVN